MLVLGVHPIQDPAASKAGEWLQQPALAIRARVPLEVLRDTTQPFPTFSEIFVSTLQALRAQIAAAPRLAGI